MSKSRFMLPVLAALAFALFTPPALGAEAANETTGKEVRTEISEAIDTIKSYTVEERNEALQQAETMLQNLDVRIERQEEDLREQWHQMNRSAREKARASLNNLKQKRSELAEWYGGLKHSSGDAWDEIKTGFSNAYSDLAVAWEDAHREFETNQ